MSVYLQLIGLSLLVVCCLVLVGYSVSVIASAALWAWRRWRR